MFLQEHFVFVSQFTYYVKIYRQYPLIFDDNVGNGIISSLQLIRGETLTIDEIRWIIIIGILRNNFDFELEFVVKYIISEPDGK